MKPVALISHDYTHHLDHIVPLCIILKCPLVVDSEKTFSAAKTFYPKLDIQLEEPIDLIKWGKQASLIIVSTKHATHELCAEYMALGHEKMRFCFAPHGHSDKGYKKIEIDPFTGQDIALIYGKKMLDRLKKKNILKTLNAAVVCGNYRAWFYNKYRPFFDRKVLETLPSLKDSSRKRYLFAPTWNDGENPSSFFDQTAQLIESLPKHIHLIVKVHPLLEKQAPASVHSIIEQYSHVPNVDILLHYPLIYPLLSMTDVYIGDYSSIGYDFLYFNRPMFFFKTSSQKVSLHQCGIEIPPKEEKIYHFIHTHLEQQNDLHSKRRSVYKQAFRAFKEDTFVENLARAADNPLFSHII